MVRVLIFEPSFRTIEDEMAAMPQVEPLILGRDGVITLGGAELTPEAAAPEIAWFSGELYQQPATRDFVAAVLASPHLKWFHTAAAGLDHPIFARVAAKGPRMTNSHGQAVGMADYVLWGVLDAFQRGPERRAAQAAKTWNVLPFREVLDTTWLIVGFGAIGQGVARRARAFGAHIVGLRRNLATDPLAEQIADLAALPAWLPKADVVVLCPPLNAQTRHLADADFFAAMKDGSVLVNVGRGALVDEPALLEALDRGVPAHAVLDVFETEPLPAESRFWSHPRVSLTAHASGVTGAQDRRNAVLFVDNLRRWLGGRPLVNDVEPKDLLATN